MGTLSRVTDYSPSVNDLLQKRADLFNEVERIRDRLSEIKNDVGAIDRTLNVLGYAGDLDAAMARQKREVILRDRKCIADLTKRVSKALRQMRDEGHVRSAVDAKGSLSGQKGD